MLFPVIEWFVFSFENDGLSSCLLNILTYALGRALPSHAADVIRSLHSGDGGVERWYRDPHKIHALKQSPNNQSKPSLLKKMNTWTCISVKRKTANVTGTKQNNIRSNMISDMSCMTYTSASHQRVTKMFWLHSMELSCRPPLKMTLWKKNIDLL